MKITIDTKEDSHLEIRKAIKLLASLVGDKEFFTNDPEPTQGMLDSPAPDMGGMMSLFDNPKTTDTPETEKKEDKTEVQFY